MAKDLSTTEALQHALLKHEKIKLNLISVSISPCDILENHIAIDKMLNVKTRNVFVANITHKKINSKMEN